MYLVEATKVDSVVSVPFNALSKLTMFFLDLLSTYSENREIYKKNLTKFRESIGYYF